MDGEFDGAEDLDGDIDGNVEGANDVDGEVDGPAEGIISPQLPLLNE